MAASFVDGHGVPSHEQPEIIRATRRVCGFVDEDKVFARLINGDPAQDYAPAGQAEDESLREGPSAALRTRLDIHLGSLLFGRWHGYSLWIKVLRRVVDGGLI